MIYDIGGVIGSSTGRAVASVGLNLSSEAIRSLRDNAKVNCAAKNQSLPRCKPLEAPCLFNVLADPCEDNNVINE